MAGARLRELRSFQACCGVQVKRPAQAEPTGQRHIAGLLHLVGSRSRERCSDQACALHAETT